MERVSAKIKGKPVNFQFGILACRLYCEYYGISLEGMSQKMAKENIFGIADMMYFGHEAYCKLNDRENKYTIEDATNWIEDIPEAEMRKVSEKVMDIKLFGKKLSEVDVKSTGKKKTGSSRKSTG